MEFSLSSDILSINSKEFEKVFNFTQSHNEIVTFLFKNTNIKIEMLWKFIEYLEELNELENYRLILINSLSKSYF